MNLSLSHVKKLSITGLFIFMIWPCAVYATAGTPVARIAILDLGNTAIGHAAAAQLRSQFSNAPGFALVDPDQAKTAAAGAGYSGSLNLSLQEARDLAAAIGCDFFIVGDADTLRRSPANTPVYFESYASIFVVSARTGRLVQWERPAATRPTAAEAEKALLNLVSSTETIQRLSSAISRAVENERAERAARVENALPVIEVMSDDAAENGATRAPRPFRRIKPEYTEAAAHSRVEAIVDVIVDIDAKGEVNHIEIARWAGYGLDESVVATVKQMHFFPAMRDGRAIPMRVLLRYNFRKPAQ